LAGTLGIIALIPPVVAIGLALWKKQLVPSLFLGIWIGEMFMAKGNVFSAFLATLDNSLRIVGNKSNLEIILFSILVGSLLALIKDSNGFQGFINWFERKKKLRSRLTVYVLTYILGISVFIENWSNILINGTTMRPLYEKLKISKERLGYFIHTISINFVAMAVINSWGAFYMSLLLTQNVDNPLRVIVKSIPFNYYCLASLVLVIIVMATGLTIGPMRKAEKAASEKGKSPALQESPFATEISSRQKEIKPRAFHMILPIIILIVMVFLSLYITGKGNLYRGSGSASVFYAVFISILLTSLYFLIKKIFKFQELMDIIFRGMSELLPIGALLVFALTMGDLCKRMGTGIYLAEFVKHNIPAFLLPALVFAISCLISFATGTSYGTFAIMVPIAIPMANIMGINTAFMFGACLSGGVFGDNCSPISDTSIVTSMGAKVSVVDHVKTQIPYALISATAAFFLFILIGLLQ